MLEHSASYIDDLDDDELGSLTSWAFNFILGLLGVTVLGLAFLTLDRNDSRYLYNPWTYAVVVPVCVVMLSAVSSALVSRLVRRSMQAAFLLSVLAHLLILTYFSNVVIHARVWNQLFDTFAQQRIELKKQQLQAKQYVKVVATTQPNRRPDYMRPVVTEHQPTEVVPPQDRKTQLAKSEVNQLISPKIDLEKSTTKHFIKRSESQRATPSLSPKAAPLSRSELSQISPEPTASPTYEIYQSEPQLQASKADSLGARSRQANESSAIQSPTNLTPDLKRENSPQTTASIQRKSASDAPSADSLAAAASLPRRSTEVRQQTRGQSIAVPSPESDASATPTLAAESNNSRRSSSSPSTTRSLEPDVPSASNSQLATNSPLKRNQSDLQIPQPTDGASSLTFARSSAGGEVGPASRSSLLVSGAESLASQTTSSSELKPGSDVARRSKRGNQAAALPQLPEVGSATSPQWDGSPSFSGGVASRSPSQLALEGNGQANSADVAGMSGTGGDIQRAAVGVAGPQGSLALPSGAIGFSETAEPSALQASGGQVQRASSNQLSFSGLPEGLSSALTDAPSSNPGTGLPNTNMPTGLQRKTGESALGIETASQGAVTIGRNNDIAAGTAPKANQIDVPSIEVGGTGDATGNPLLGSAGTIQRNRTEGTNSRLQIPLEIDANSGSGGLGLVSANEANPLLPRKSGEEVRIDLPGIDVQKFARSEVGGPLGGGTNVALPTPAFQQRLDRLDKKRSEAGTDTEMAIERGLEFLARYQRDDGSWRLQDFDTNVLIRSDTAATALSILAFQGAGYTHVQSKYANQVNRAIEFLASHQKPNGDLYITQDPASDQNAWLYSHAIASLALCEAYGMTQDERLKPVAQRAIDFMVASQDPRRGGWRYRPGNGSDTSVTGWYMMALQSGRLAGLNVPETTLDLIKSFVENAQNGSDEPHIYRYNPFAPDTPEQRHGLQPTAVMTSVGLLIRLYHGWSRENKAMMDGASYLLIHSPQNGTKQQSRRDTYYWYYATQVIFHMGGDYWKKWQENLNPMLIKEQVASGQYSGSWDPNEPVPDLWAKYGGRLYVTTMNLLSLEVSYRHLPLYEAVAD
jgi:hypothetical protein